jgi:hypothetical protein
MGLLRFDGEWAAGRHRAIPQIKTAEVLAREYTALRRDADSPPTQQRRTRPDRKIGPDAFDVQHGAYRVRTDDLPLAKRMLSQLS